MDLNSSLVFCFYFCALKSFGTTIIGSLARRYVSESTIT